MKTITTLVLSAAFLFGCKGKENDSEHGNMGMDFLTDTSASIAAYASNSENGAGSSWEGKYYPLYKLQGDTIVKDMGGAVSFKMAPDGKGVYRIAKLFGDHRSDYFAFNGTSTDQVVSDRFKNWTYWRLNDSMLRDNSGNIFLKAK